MLWTELCSASPLFHVARHHMKFKARPPRVCRHLFRSGARPQREEDVVALLHEIRAAAAARDHRLRKRLVATLARRHRLYPLPHCLSRDDDRHGAFPPHLRVEEPAGYFAMAPADSFHFKLNA
jgi:hypothetical protein